MRETHDEDVVMKEDINKLIKMIKEKARRMKVQSSLSPTIYGIDDTHFINK